ncbi:dienelactone hydrolase family protein [Chitinophagaceae bacterium LB-8]|uniref:Dienelactone hydrolase family protein n=1 Tax=Paraflavisolibacter caeni TaxID=2982496 RepID=A0A9X2XSE8_9BACT|nr:dienelactone hydrolase family protein [Paraflavisolibacter caeni]MCU7548209.1 dienelactone hydrolase family protein [Paraflavisolibacter caeni]
MDSKHSAIFAGSRQLEVTDESLGISFPVLVHYPTYQPSTPTPFGPYIMDVSPQADIIDGQFPLAIISHGNGGSHLLYRTISIYLAKNGYIVAMPEHYGNNRNNNELAQSTENLVLRPKHVSLTIDALLSEKDLGKCISPNNIGVAGHSFGGYTALALAGGIPWTQTGQKVEAPHDPRVKALVLMAPAAGWFIPKDSLAEVTVPILLFAAERDPYTPKWNADVIINGVSDKSQVTFRLIEGAGHFSFLSPFPPAMKHPGFLPSTDPEGFDREQFHIKLPQEILKFLNEQLHAS